MKNKGMELYAIVCGFMPLPYIRMVFFNPKKVSGNSRNRGSVEIQWGNGFMLAL